MILVPLACAAYDFIPNEHLGELPFFLVFGGDPILPLDTLLEPRVGYLGNDINRPFLRCNEKYAQDHGSGPWVGTRERGSPGSTII